MEALVSVLGVSIVGAVIGFATIMVQLARKAEQNTREDAHRIREDAREDVKFYRENLLPAVEELTGTIEGMLRDRKEHLLPAIKEIHDMLSASQGGRDV